jgi:hypothetical protein
VDQLAHAPAGEGLAEAPWTLGGRLDDQLALLSRHPAGTATRPLRVQGAHPLVVEGMDHFAHPVRTGLDQPGDDRHVVAAGRSEHDEGPAPLDDRLVGLSAAPAHDPLELPTLLVGEPAHLHWSTQTVSLRDPPAQVVDAPPRLVVRALAGARCNQSWSAGLAYSAPTCSPSHQESELAIRADGPLHVHEGQLHELGEPARLTVQVRLFCRTSVAAPRKTNVRVCSKTPISTRKPRRHK